MNEYVINGTLKVARLAADPSPAENGCIYYNTTSNTFRCYENGSWTTLGSGGGSGVTSLNGETGALAITAGPNITITPSGSDIEISATSGETVQEFTLSPTDISNGYVTLSTTPVNPTLALLNVIGGPMQSYGSDFTISGTHLSWTGNLASVIASGDMLVVQYS
jgi:hypothetical protein